MMNNSLLKILLFSAPLMISACVSDPTQIECYYPNYVYEFSGKTFPDRNASRAANPTVNLDIVQIKHYSPVVFSIASSVRDDSGSASSGSGFTFNFSLFPQAHALFADCNPPLPVEAIKAIEIRSVYGFDDQHPAGAVLNDLILMRTYSNGEWFPGVHIDTPISLDLLQFQFYKYPSISSVQSFTVKVLLERGGVYEVEMDDIDFEKHR